MNFDPSQPRDGNGMWVKTGVGGPAHVHAKSFVKKHHLKPGQYVVHGSAVQELHGIRGANDVDIVLPRKDYNKRFKSRKQEYREQGYDLQIGQGPIGQWRGHSGSNMLKDYELHGGVAYTSLENHLREKKVANRAKDQRDIYAIQQRLRYAN